MLEKQITLNFALILTLKMVVVRGLKNINLHKSLGLFPDCDDFDEDKYTLKYMSKYGVDNVRGGSFCQTTLSRENINTIERMISSSNDCCHFCGEKGHFIGRCSNKKEKQKYSKQNKHFLQLSKDYESADEVEWDYGSDDDGSDDGVEEQSWLVHIVIRVLIQKREHNFMKTFIVKRKNNLKKVMKVMTTRCL